MTSEHPSIAHFRRDWLQRGGTGRIVVLDEGVHTAKLAAEALGCEVGAIANSLLFDLDDRPVLILTSGSHRVDVDLVSPVLNEALGTTGGPRRAAPDFVRRHTGQVIGGVSPFAHPAPVPTFLDVALREHPVIWAAAGHPAAVFSSTYPELQALTGAIEITVG